MLKKLSLILLVSLFLLSGCSIPGISMPNDGPEVQVSEEAAQSLEQKAIEAAANSGTSTISVTQEEVTSYIALRLDTILAEQGVENPWQNPQVHFKEDGTVVMRGDIEYEGYMQPIRLVAQPTVVDGSLQVDVIEGRLGPVPVPNAILDQGQDYLAQAILAGQKYARLDEVRVEAAVVTLTGARQ